MRRNKNRASHTEKRRLFGALWKKLFCHRNIIIISDHKTEHLPFSVKLQCALIVSVMGFVIWASYSTGNYMAAQNSLREKERKIATTSLENRRIESEFALLKRDLISMMEEDSAKSDMSDYAKFVVKQYKDGDIEAKDVDVAQLGSAQHGAVFERIAFLEKKMDEIKTNHQQVMEAIRESTKDKLYNLESIIRSTGLNVDTLEKKVVQLEPRKHHLKSGPQGGPFNPVEDEFLANYDDGLYQDLKRMSLLSDVLETLPLAQPMTNYKLTSGYGVRVDPFRRRFARHEGLDFSGPYGSRILATSDGVVKKAQRSGAYGLMVEVQHPLGVSTLYGHMQRILVKPGQRVKQGDVLGIQGSTGRSTGPHLHYEVRYYGNPLNPQPFLKAGTHVRQIKTNSGS